ncbi:MAG TPA: MarR family transcriptional regulator [Candidatus Limnocylindrales bacterium]|nr:MarR family transcriptional regulator [Candidatus Limnocylindrales bacterium]
MASRTVTRTASSRRDSASDPLLEALERLSVGIVGVTSAVFAGDPPIDLTLLQWRTLVVTTEADNGLRISELAAHVGASLPSASRLVERLVRRGLVSVEPDPADRRARIVRPTPAGLELRSRLVERRRDLLAQRVRTISIPRSVVPTLEALGNALAGDR